MNKSTLWLWGPSCNLQQSHLVFDFGTDRCCWVPAQVYHDAHHSRPTKVGRTTCLWPCPCEDVTRADEEDSGRIFGHTVEPLYQGYATWFIDVYWGNGRHREAHEPTATKLECGWGYFGSLWYVQHYPNLSNHAYPCLPSGNQLQR